MTPLKLIFKGINSYYDEVFIDFRALTKKGLFGIFGPTGSGKTTILDAMIIALYGQKSIPRSNADFINSKSDKAFICFEFEMDDSLYTVRRSFKRSTESIITDSAVLTRNSLAVAEKAKNVDSYIIQTIGLQAKDFTKCVMLPQGQFNEFLTSKGRDRSEILEKIFDLQQYGSILQQKAASYFNELKMRRSVIESKLSLYTNISVQNIVTLKEKSNELKKKKELLSVQSEQLEQQSALIRSQLQDLETLRKEEKRLKELMTQKEYVRSLKTTADKALAASQVFPVLEQCEKLSSSISQTTGEKNDHEKTLGELKIQLDKMEKEYLDSKQQYQEKLPQIIADCENIKSFIEKKTQAQKIEKECLSLKEKLSEAQTRKESLNLELSKIEETKKQLNDLQEKTEAGRKIFLVLPQQRQDNDTINQLTLKASSLAKNIKKLSGQVKEAEIRLESSAKSLDMLKQKEGLCKEQLGQKQ
nr:SMC family ATPase [Petrotogaceae bacterium]